LGSRLFHFLNPDIADPVSNRRLHSILLQSISYSSSLMRAAMASAEIWCRHER
jgi:hypothetical protein